MIETLPEKQPGKHGEGKSNIRPERDWLGIKKPWSQKYSLLPHGHRKVTRPLVGGELQEWIGGGRIMRKIKTSGNEGGGWLRACQKKK